jgi:hypothetical protein
VDCIAPEKQPRSGRCNLFIEETRAYGAHLGNDRVGLVVCFHVDAVSFEVQVGFNVKGRCLFRAGQPSVSSRVEC